MWLKEVKLIFKQFKIKRRLDSLKWSASFVDPHDWRESFLKKNLIPVAEMNLTSIHFNQENLTSIRWPYVNIGPIHKCNRNRGFTSATRIELRFPLATGIDLGFVDHTGIFEKDKQCMFPLDLLLIYHLDDNDRH